MAAPPWQSVAGWMIPPCLSSVYCASRLQINKDPVGTQDQIMRMHELLYGLFADLVEIPANEVTRPDPLRHPDSNVQAWAWSSQPLDNRSRILSRFLRLGIGGIEGCGTYRPAYF